MIGTTTERPSGALRWVRQEGLRNYMLQQQVVVETEVAGIIAATTEWRAVPVVLLDTMPPAPKPTRE